MKVYRQFGNLGLKKTKGLAQMTWILFLARHSPLLPPKVLNWSTSSCTSPGKLRRWEILLALQRDPRHQTPASHLQHRRNARFSRELSRKSPSSPLRCLGVRGSRLGLTGCRGVEKLPPFSSTHPAISQPFLFLRSWLPSSSSRRPSAHPLPAAGVAVGFPQPSTSR